MSLPARLTIQTAMAEFRRGRSVLDALDRHDAAASAPDGQGDVVYTVRTEGRARRAARAAEARHGAGRPLSPIDGIAVSVKDMFDLAGLPTTLGLPVLEKSPPAQRDAEVVVRLCAAGAVITGRTNMTPLALSCLGVNSHLGTPLSPWRRDEGRIAGGSSSGAAASVADHMVLAAIATDTGGSARIPAAFCGLTGFKASRGRVPDRGCFPISESLDSIGVIAPTVDCCAAIDAIISGAPAADDADLAGIRFALADSFLVDDLDPVVAAGFDAAIARLARAGVRLRPVKVPFADPMRRIGELGGLSAVEGARAHGDLLARLDGHCDPRILGRYLAAAKTSSRDYQAMLRIRQEMVDWANADRAWDILVYPTSPILPPRLADLASDSEYFAANGRIYRNAGPANLADCCAITLPCPAPRDAPVGLTLMAPRNSDALLLSVARQLEQVVRQNGT